MARVEFGLIVPDDTLDAAHRHGYMARVSDLLSLVTGRYVSAWCIDHLEGELLEGWTSLAYLSALHPDLLWGHSVLCNGFRNPALVAKMSASLAFMSGGRYVLGIGTGSQAREHLAYGYEFPRGRVRVTALDEALTIIRAMWTQERVSFEGRHYRVMAASCEPKPDPVPPIMIGAFGPKMLRLAARHAGWWNVSSTGIKAYRRYVEEFERACDEVGRDPATVRGVWAGGCACAPNEADVAVLAGGRRVSGEDFVGTPAQIIEQMQPFIELGVDCFLLDCGGFPRLTTVETLIDEVLPVLNR
jgi:alkanesulfonate monooxygenase SsuD/methylene tetrahydromethanopterin reductase-like flavin-dependent oxidoreductase (luciferase family)